MANRIITAAVTGETIKLSNKTAGAAGSFNAVSLSLTFDSAWDGTTKKLYFFDAYGNNAVYILLTADLLVNGAYVVPIPAEPLVYAGEMTVTIKGVDFATDGETAERIIMSASTTMKVLSSITPASDVAPVEPTPTQAEQLLTAVNTYNSAESTRVSNETARGLAETSRASAEITRATNENARIANEGNASSGRVKAEADRVTAESSRVTAETNRGNAETTRGSNETTRQSNETARQNNESARVSAESTRAAFYDGFSSSISELSTKVKPIDGIVIDNGLVVAVDGVDFANSPQTAILPDKSYNRNDARAYGFGYTGTSGSDGLGGIVFNGTSSYLELLNSSGISISGSITVDVVFKLNSLTGWQDVINKTLGSGYSLEYNVNSDNKIGFYAHIGGAYRGAKSDAALSVGTIYHIVGRYDGTAVELFVNGVKQTSRTAVSGAIATNTEKLRIGRGADTYYLNGVVYSVKIYNTALTDGTIASSNTQVKTLYSDYIFDHNKNAKIEALMDYVGDTQCIKQIAHRGYIFGAPENTLPAFSLAKKRGFKYVEADVLWTSDNIPVICHDDTIDRTSDGTGAITSFTYNQLLSYDFGSWFNAAFTGTRIPLFRDFILLCKKLSLHPYIEIKSNINASQATILCDIVRKLGMLRYVTWISYTKADLLLIKAIDAKANFGLAYPANSVASGQELLSESNEVSMSVDQLSLTQAIAEEILTAGLGLMTFEIISTATLDSLANLGVTEILTDGTDIHRYYHMI